MINARRRRHAWLALMALGTVLVAGCNDKDEPSAEARGRAEFQRCMACHEVATDRHKVGPSLQGVIGRPAASASGFRYSPALQAAAEGGLVWTDETLHAYLADPRGFVPGNRMAFPGIKDPAEVDALIGYMRSAGGGS